MLKPESVCVNYAAFRLTCTIIEPLLPHFPPISAAAGRMRPICRLMASRLWITMIAYRWLVVILSMILSCSHLPPCCFFRLVNIEHWEQKLSPWGTQFLRRWWSVNFLVKHSQWFIERKVRHFFEIEGDNPAWIWSLLCSASDCAWHSIRCFHVAPQESPSACFTGSEPQRGIS